MCVRKTHMETNYTGCSVFWTEDICDISRGNWNGFVICDRWRCMKYLNEARVSGQRCPPLAPLEQAEARNSLRTRVKISMSTETMRSEDKPFKKCSFQKQRFLVFVMYFHFLGTQENFCTLLIIVAISNTQTHVAIGIGRSRFSRRLGTSA